MLLEKIKNYINEKNSIADTYCFDNIKLRGVEVDTYKKTAKYYFSFPQELSESRFEELKEAVAACSVAGYRTIIDVVVDKMDADVAKRLLVSFIKENCVSLDTEMAKQGVFFDATAEENRIVFTLKATKRLREILQSGSLDKIKEYFNNYTCHSINFLIEEVEESSEDTNLLESLEQIRERTFDAWASQPPRKILLEESRELIGKLKDVSPKFIIDVKPEEESVVVCGKISNIVKFKAKTTDTVICKFSLKDFSGNIPVVFFAKNEKLLGDFSSLYENDEIVVVGKSQINSYDNMLEILARSIGRCKISEQSEVFSEFKPLPSEYAVVCPSLFSENTQADIFNAATSVPSVLKGKSFVVFDFETTGKEQRVNAITEVGAVKIVDGRMVESFFTLINPQRKIPPNIVELTGITDDMVKNKPLFQEVVGDFYRFCHGSVLVAHNADFDYGFLTYYAKPCGYLFNNEIIDTIAMARRFYDKPENKNNKPENFKLETLVKNLNLNWDRPHRAESDAVTEAMLFLKLISMDETLLQ